MSNSRSTPDVWRFDPVAGIRRAAFWGSVGLPVVYVPLYAGSGTMQLLGVGATVLHALCLAVGHDHVPDGSTGQ